MSNEHRRADSPSPEEEEAPLLNRPFVLVLMASTCFAYAFSTFFLLPKYLSLEFGASASEIGLLVTVAGISAVISMFGVGVWVDLHDRRLLLLLGALLMSASTLAFAWVDAMGPMIFVLRVLHALAFSMVFIACSSLTVEYAPEARLGQALGIFGLTSLPMNALAPVAVEKIAAVAGWSWAFGSAAAAAFACALVAFWMPASKPRSIERRPDSSAFAEMVRGAEARRIAGVMFLVGAAFATLFTYHQLFALQLGFGEVYDYFAAYALMAIFARAGLGRVGDRFGRRRVAILTLILYALATFGMIWLLQLGLAVLGAVFGLAHGLFYPTYSALCVADVADEGRGKRMATLQAWFNLGVAFASYAMGLIAEARGYEIVFAIVGCGLLGAIAILLSEAWSEGRSASVASGKVLATSSRCVQE